MNKLNGSTTYLIGAIDRCLDRGAGWRDFISPHLKNMGIRVFNPLSKPIDRERALEDSKNFQKRQEWKLNRQYDKFKEAREVRTVDLRMVDVSDFIICNIDVEVHACGTYEELFLANRQKKPVLVHCEQGKRWCPDWLFLTLPHQHIFDNWEDLLEHLVYVNMHGNDITERWVLFEYED